MSKRQGRQAKAVKLKLHDQEWRDFQPVAEAEGNPGKFKAVLKQTVEKIRQRSVKALRVGETQT